MTPEDYNRPLIRALERAQAKAGFRSAAAFARRLAERTGGPPDPSTYQRWLRGESLIPGWALLVAAEENGVDPATLLGQEPQDDRLADLEHRLAAVENAIKNMNPSVASAIIVRKEKVLMTRRRPHKGPVRWNFVTGNVEPDETPEETVVREVHDEVGLDVVVERRLGDRIHPASGRHMIYFACRIVGGEPFLADHEENAELRWATLAEAEKLLVPTGGVWTPIRDYITSVIDAPVTRSRP